MVLVAALAACGGGSDGSGSVHGGGRAGGSYAARQDERPTKVTGLRDTERHITRRTTRASRPHYVKKCETDTRKVKHTKRSKGRTRTWYTTTTERDCHKVRSGTETYTRVLRRERWCVRLDDVHRKPAKSPENSAKSTGKDNVWFRVPAAEYSKVHGADARAKVTIEPTGKGC
ncbi:hypothetical protein J3486_06465 [Streptomyces sp. VRA16 Mangrove soil]|nr:hypothetical protein [Streptomyces sp. VRA16 Mangrove soil]